MSTIHIYNFEKEKDEDHKRGKYLTYCGVLLSIMNVRIGQDPVVNCDACILLYFEKEAE